MSDQRRPDATPTPAGRWDPAALRAGAGVCLLIALPATVLGALVDGLRGLSFFVALGGFVIGSGCAAWTQRTGTPLSHGIVTAIGTYVAAQLVFVVARLVAGREVEWAAVIVTLSLVSFAGLVGGFLGSRLLGRGVVPSTRR